MRIFAAFRGGQGQRDLTREQLTETVMAILTRPAMRNLFSPTRPRLLCNRIPGTCASPTTVSRHYMIVNRGLWPDDEMAPTILLITGF